MTVSSGPVSAPEQRAGGTGRQLIGALLRERRRQMRMTLQALGDAAGVSVGYLSQVERDLVTPSLGTLAQIARSLNAEIDHFLTAPAIENSLSRAEGRAVFSVGSSVVRYEQIGADFAGNQLSSFIITIPPGHQSEEQRHEGEEIVFMLSGAVEFGVNGEVRTLTTGDGLHFRSQQPHFWHNRSAETARVLWTGTLPLYRPRVPVPLAPILSQGIDGSAADPSPARARKTEHHRKQEI